MREALSTATQPIGYINPHATSTPIGDEKEAEALRQVFGTDIPPLSGTKSLSGHSLGAAGVQEAIYSLIMMHEKFLCSSAHIENRDPLFADLPIIEGQARQETVNAVMSNSFGFGGTNATLVFERI